MSRSVIVIGILNLALQVAVVSVTAARPFITDDAGTVTQGTFEQETGCDFRKDAAAAGINLKHGITDRMDIGIGFGYVPLPDEGRGFEGAELGLKFGLVPDLFSVSACGSFSDDTYSANAILTRGFSTISFDINLGMTAEAGTKEADLTYGLCCHYDGERCCCGAEIGGTHDCLSLWLLGGNFGLFDWVAVDAAINGDFKKEMTLSATVGLTFAFPAIETEQ